MHLSEPDGWPRVHRVHAEAIGRHRPARAILTVAVFPGRFKIEIDAIARLPD